MTIPGGGTDKVGNRYELRWTVRQFIRADAANGVPDAFETSLSMELSGELAELQRQLGQRVARMELCGIRGAGDPLRPASHAKSDPLMVGKGFYWQEIKGKAVGKRGPTPVRMAYVSCGGDGGELDFKT